MRKNPKELIYQYVMVVYCCDASSNPHLGIHRVDVYGVESLNLSDFGRSAVRLRDTSIGRAEEFAQGMVAAGCVVRSVWCNCPQYEKIDNAKWREDLDRMPGRDFCSPVKGN